MCPVHFAFLRAFRATTRSNTSKRIFTDVANDLKFWAEHSSWAYCTCCGLPQSRKLLPAFCMRTQPASSQTWACRAARYKVPHLRRVPAPLQNLTMDEIYALRPFRLFSGRYTRMMFGYRMREEPLKIKWARDDVQVKSATLLTLSPGEGPRALRLLNEQDELLLQEIHPNAPQPRP